MKAWLCWLLLPVVLGKVKLGKHIVKYTEEKLNYVLNQAERPPIFLELFSPSCPACAALAPQMSQAAAKLKDQAPEMKVVAVDGTQAESTMKDLGAAEFPALFLLSQSNKTYRLQLTNADSSDAIARWALRAAAPAVRRLEGGAAPAVTETPQLVLRAEQMVPAFETLAEERKMDFEAFWIPDATEPGRAVASLRHLGQPEVNFTFSHLTSDSLDDEGERFEDFVKDHTLPAVILVKEPRKAMKMLDRHQDAMLLWVVLNSSKAGCEETCSAVSSGPARKQDLEDTLRPWRKLLEESRAAYQATASEPSQRKKLFVLAVDIQHFPNFVESELYAWQGPSLVAQRFRHGPRYFFSDVPGTMPESAAEVADFLKGLLKRNPRQMSERPEPQEAQHSKLWRKLVNVDVEEQLRSSAATVLYTFKSPDSISNDDEVIDFEDEMEALNALADWLNKTCERPPPLAALDVRKNEVPLSLYAAASIGGLNAPSLYFIESDLGKNPVGIRWAGDIAEFQKTVEKDPSTLLEIKRRTFLSGQLNSIIPWILEQSQRMEAAFQVPSAYVPGAGAVFKQKALAVLDLRGEADVQKLLQRKESGFMEFYSPSCGACKSFAPSYEAAARKASNFTFGRLDCSTAEGERCCNKRGIDKYPTVFYMTEGRLEPYPGGPQRDQLLEFLATQSSPLLQEVESMEAALALVAAKPVVAWVGAENRTEVEEVAESFRQEVKVAIVKGQEDTAESVQVLWPSASGKQGPSVFPKDLEFSQEELLLWLAQELVRSAPVPLEQTHPVLTVVGSTFRSMLYGPLASGKHVMLEVYAPWCGHCKKLAPIYEEFAQKMQDEGRDLVVLKLDGQANGIPFDGFDYTGFPTIFYLSPESAEIQKVQARTMDGLLAFVRQKRIPTGGQAAPVGMEDLLSRFRSEEPPSVQTSPVLTVVLRNFVDVVFNDKRHCILMIHDKKCPHCQQMMTELESFAKDLKEEVFVAKMDGKLNDLPLKGFEFEGFPKLFFIEAGQKEPTFKQIGSNALHAMRRFMEEKGLLRRSAVEAEL